MGDLERKLKELFEADASRAPLVATPPAGLRPRIRRLQARSAIAGATAFLVVAGVVGTATWAGLSRRDAIPAGNDVPMRVTVDRFTIDVPQGWTALDTSFVQLVMATESETCSFSSEGTPVTGGTTTDAGQDLEASPEGSERCTREPITYPAGLPLLQLTERDVSDLDQTECGTRLGEGRDEAGANAFVGDDSGFYLALLPGVTGLPEWPVPLENGEGPCGEGSYARFSVGGEAYLAFAGFGPDVAPQARDALLSAVSGMDVHQVAPRERELPIAGPAVFLASGELDGTRWQVSAGITLDASTRNTPTAWAELVSADGIITDTLGVPWRGDGPAAASMSLGDRQIAVALLPDSMSNAAWESDDGTLTELSIAPAPAIMTLPPTSFSGGVGWTLALGNTGRLIGAEAEDASPGGTPSMEISGWTAGDRRFTITGRHARVDGVDVMCVRLDADTGSEQTCRDAIDVEGVATMYITELEGPLAVIAGVVPDDTATFVVRDAADDRVITTQQTVDGGGDFPNTAFLFVVLEEPHPELVMIEGFDASGARTFAEKEAGGVGL